MNRLVLIWLTSVMCAASSVSAQELTDEDIAKLQKLFKQGRAHYDQKEYEKSNKSYEEVLERLPKADLDINTAMLLFNIGGNYALLGQKEKAFESLEKAVGKGFWDTDALENAPDLASLRGADGFDDLLKKSRAGLGSIAFGLKDLKGNELKKEDYEGKVIVLDVWGTWCPPCRMEIPHFVKLQKEYKDKGLAIIGLTWERRAPDETLTKQVASFASHNEVNYPLVMISESRLSLIPDLSGFPTTLFVGRDGTVHDRISGYHPYEDLRTRVTRLLREKAPEKVVVGD